MADASTVRGRPFGPDNPGGPGRPFQKGRSSAGRPSPLSDPEYVELFAQAYANGRTGPELADDFNVSETTVKRYKRDPRVKNAALKFIEDRVLRISRKIDAQIEERLAHVSDMDIKTMLDIRKEFLGGVMRQQAQGGKLDDRAINDAMEAMEDDPQFAADLQALLEREPAKTES